MLTQDAPGPGEVVTGTAGTPGKRHGRSDRTRNAALACLFAVWLAFTFPMFAGRVHFPTDFAEAVSVHPGQTPRLTSNLTDSDDFFLLYPWHEYLGQQLREGHFPLWDPSRFLGVPFAADIPIGAFYPPNWLYAFGSVPMDSTIIWALTIAASLLLTFWFLRILRLHPFAAAAGALVWTFSGFMLGWAGFDAFIASAVWLPMALVGLEHALHGRPRRGVPIAGLALALSVLGGHAQISLYVWLGAAVWAAVTILAAAVAARSSGGHAVAAQLVRGCGLTGLAFVLAAGLAAPQILGAAEYARLIVRQKETYAAAVLYHLVPGDLATLLIPDYRGNSLAQNYMGFVGLYVESTIFAGVLAVPLGIAGLVHRNRRVVVSFAVLTLVGLLGATGTPLTRLLVLLPGLSRTREVTRLKVLLDFGLAGMVALGLDALLSRQSLARWVALTVAAACAAAIVVMVSTRAGTTVTAAYLTPRGLRELAILAAGILAVAIAGHSLTLARAGGLALVALIGLDLWFYGFPFHPFQPDTPMYPPLAETRSLAAAPGPRPRYVMSGGMPIPINSSMVYGLYSLNGYDAFIPGDYVSLVSLVDPELRLWALNNNIPNLPGLGANEPPILDLLGVRSVMTPNSQPAPGTLVAAGPSRPYTKSASIYDEADSFPPAFLTPCWSIEGDGAALSTLASATDAQLRSTAVVAPGNGSGRLGAPPATCPSTPAVTTASYQAQEVVLSVPGGSPGGVVVLSDEWFPGWVATLDGRQVPILRVDEALRGVAVGPGAHTITFVYQPRWLPDGLALTAFSIVLTALVVLAPRRRHRPAPAGRVRAALASPDGGRPGGPS